MNVARALAAPRDRLAIHDVGNVVARDRQAAVAGCERTREIVPSFKVVDRQTAILARTEPAGVTKSKARKPVQGVVITVEPKAARDGEIGGDVPASFTKDRIVLVLTLLVRQPDRSRVVADGQVRCEIIDKIVLEDVVLLILIEGADERAERLVGG